MLCKVNRDYRAVYRSQPIAFSKGDTVDVDADQAAWVNDDSPGCLTPLDAPAEEEPAEEEPAQEEPAQEEPAAEEPAEEEPAEPKKNASHDAWVAFAVARGADPVEAAELSRDDLVELYGS